MQLDLITVGRISVDLFAEQINTSFSQPQTFHKSIGGSPTNVAVAAAKLGHSSAVVTKVGVNPLGQYVLKRGVRIAIVKMGGDPGSNWEEVFAKWEKALSVPNIRSLVPGRALLYGEDLDVEAAVSRAAKLVRKG